MRYEPAAYTAAVTGGVDYMSWLYRARSKAQVTGLSTAVPHAVEFYVFAVAAGDSGGAQNAFDENGDGVGNSVFTRFCSVDASADAIVTSSYLEQTASLPTWCAEPVLPPPASRAGRGWAADVWMGTSQCALIRWDFEYQG